MLLRGLPTHDLAIVRPSIRSASRSLRMTWPRVCPRLFMRCAPSSPTSGAGVSENTYRRWLDQPRPLGFRAAGVPVHRQLHFSQHYGPRAWQTMRRCAESCREISGERPRWGYRLAHQLPRLDQTADGRQIKLPRLAPAGRGLLRGES
jgi:hypothetical protein